jgi:Phage protein (N4 Gp49/phage Sf6 gene 66) family
MTNREAALPLIEKVDYQQMGKRTTICLITCKNGFEIAGSTATADHTEFDAEIGRHWALENAVDKLIMYATFHLMQKSTEADIEMAHASEKARRVNAVNDLIKQLEKETDGDGDVAEMNAIEEKIDSLQTDFGKQDGAVMRLRNELRLLKRSLS